MHFVPAHGSDTTLLWRQVPGNAKTPGEFDALGWITAGPAGNFPTIGLPRLAFGLRSQTISVR
jgi:hypothetical protein